MAESGPVTRALVDITRSGADDRDLAAQFCRACLGGMNIDGAALSVFTASVSRATLAATDATAAQLEDLQFTLGEGACLEVAAISFGTQSAWTRTQNRTCCRAPRRWTGDQGGPCEVAPTEAAVTRWGRRSKILTGRLAGQLVSTRAKSGTPPR